MILPDSYAILMRAAIAGAKMPRATIEMKVHRVAKLLPVAEAAVTAGVFDLIEPALFKALADLPDWKRRRVYRGLLSERVRDALRGPPTRVHTCACGDEALDSVLEPTRCAS